MHGSLRLPPVLQPRRCNIRIPTWLTTTVLPRLGGLTLATRMSQPSWQLQFPPRQPQAMLGAQTEVSHARHTCWRKHKCALQLHGCTTCTPHEGSLSMAPLREVHCMVSHQPKFNLHPRQAEQILCCEGPAPEGFPPDLPAPEALTPADANEAEPLMPLVSTLSCELLPNAGGRATSTETKTWAFLLQVDRALPPADEEVCWVQSLSLFDHMTSPTLLPDPYAAACKLGSLPRPRCRPFEPT